MSINFCVADATTGIIKRTGTCQEKSLHLQAKAGEVVIPCTQEVQDALNRVASEWHDRLGTTLRSTNPISEEDLREVVELPVPPYRVNVVGGVPVLVPSSS